MSEDTSFQLLFLLLIFICKAFELRLPDELEILFELAMLGLLLVHAREDHSLEAELGQ